MNIALIFAGGTGQRMNSRGKPKQFLELHGKPIIIYTLEWFEKHKDIDYIVISCLESWIDYLEELVQRYHLNKVKWIVKGGTTSQESIFNGLDIINKEFSEREDTVVLIHDGVRPLINEELISKNIEAVKEYGSAITVTYAKETVIEVSSEEKWIENVCDRHRCRIAKAPQSFYLKDIYEAHLKAKNDGKNYFIDSADLMRHYGYSLYSVEGPNENIKITTPVDFYIFKAVCDARESSQILGL